MSDNETNKMLPEIGKSNVKPGGIFPCDCCEYGELDGVCSDLVEFVDIATGETVCRYKEHAIRKSEYEGRGLGGKKVEIHLEEDWGKTLYRQVKAMREAQKKYFKTPREDIVSKRVALETSKSLEQAVDFILNRFEFLATGKRGS